MDTDTFFPSSIKDPIERKKREEAKATCERCPVQVQCLEYALVVGETSGIWGGKSERERIALRRRFKLEHPGKIRAFPSRTHDPAGSGTDWPRQVTLHR
jgi:WhiB family redox-sensing transcriptional regulator